MWSRFIRNKKYCQTSLLDDSRIKLERLSGLEHYDTHHVLHRNIKGSNLLINYGGVLKIGDYGLASFFDPKSQATKDQSGGYSMVQTIGASSWGHLLSCRHGPLECWLHFGRVIGWDAYAAWPHRGSYGTY
ncbi:unnamed protein product [Ilex paraguariensis]|uniref:Protein kinase domain-containing protein n=1 Tax=Ilex paraguariensis TaxID=185542 RepID=A0ABC8RDX2_9AQUA